MAQVRRYFRQQKNEKATDTKVDSLDIATEIESQKRALTVAEVATRLGLSQRHLREMAVEGKVPAIQLGTVWRFDCYQVAAWLRRHYTGVTSTQLR